VSKMNNSWIYKIRRNNAIFEKINDRITNQNKMNKKIIEKINSPKSNFIFYFLLLISIKYGGFMIDRRYLRLIQKEILKMDYKLKLKLRKYKK
jgi:hypothetical protein